MIIILEYRRDVLSADKIFLELYYLLTSDCMK